ncbi:MAG: hypothetical protein KatS3mg060_0923 [Dehalococcoidia bacterium]|nr:MAG: hypothetical protein KatS3mg060_0923 [Dehalococcoidia bacterium]
MFKWLTNLLTSDSPEKTIKRLTPVVAAINALEPEMSPSSATTSCAAKRRNSGSGWPTARTLDDLLPEAFAAVREASRRSIGLRHYDVQLMGGIVLHEGKIAEMKTG